MKNYHNIIFVYNSLTALNKVLNNSGPRNLRCWYWHLSFQITFSCSKSKIETLEKGVKYVQS